MRGRRYGSIQKRPRQRFQSTPPCGGDEPDPGDEAHSAISIHAPLRGRPKLAYVSIVPIPISIHAPLRGRLPLSFRFLYSRLFQSTPPCGGDTQAPTWCSASADFNPRPLAGATGRYLLARDANNISIHAPLRGRQAWNGLTARCRLRFQSTPPCGGDFII